MDSGIAHLQPDASQKEWLMVAKAALRTEAEGIAALAERIDGNLTKAVELIMSRNGKVVVCGIGKSGHIGQKIAATLCSTGTPAISLHPSEAVHGDLGVYSPGDPTILISKSGNTAELLRLMPLLRSFSSPLIAIVGNLSSRITVEADIVLDATVAREADPLGIVPTASTTAALAIGDALACALMTARGFSADDFARFHPSGQLGRNLHLCVADVVHRGAEVAWVGPNSSLRDVVIAMTEHPLGAACVVDTDGILLGIVTDGDVRRTLRRFDQITGVSAKEIMTVAPITVATEVSLADAVKIMEDRPSQIYVLPVVDAAGKCLGLLRLHDIYQPELG